MEQEPVGAPHRAKHTSTPIDHLILGSPNLEAGVREFEQLTGVSPSFGGEHRGHGTSNYLVPAGGHSYIELLGPTSQASEEDEWGLRRFPGTRLMGLVMSTENLDGLMQKAGELGLKMDKPRDGSRVTPAGEVLRWRVSFFDRSLFGEFLVFAIEWGDVAHPSTGLVGNVTVGKVTVRSPAAQKVALYLHSLCNADIEVSVCEEGLHLEAVLETGERSIAVSSSNNPRILLERS